MPAFPPGVQCMNPVDVRPVAVPAVDDRPRIRHRARDAPAGTAHHALGQRVAVQRLGDAMPDNIRVLRKRRLHVERDQMNLRRDALGQMPRQLIVGAVHPAVGREIAGNQHESFHASSFFGNCATPCSTPARNQNCKPICVVNGVKPKTSAMTPALEVKIIAAYGAADV